jgi:hypothetical protein
MPWRVRALLAPPQLRVHLDGPLTLRQLFQGLKAFLHAPIDPASLIKLLAEGWFNGVMDEYWEPPEQRFELLGDHVFVEGIERRGPAGHYYVSCGS